VFFERWIPTKAGKGHPLEGVPFIRKPMKRRCAVILMAVIALAVIPVSSAHSMGRRNKGRELEFWHSMSIYQGNSLEKLIAEYNASQERVTVRPVFQGLYDEMRAKLMSALNTRDAPDLV
jgi:ABC-type glycerol-3-phosphate transport system substrate-binding protein